MHRLKPSRNPNSHEGSIRAYLQLFAVKHNATDRCVKMQRSDAKKPSAYVRPRRGAMNPHTARTMIAPTIAPMKPAFSPALYHPIAWPRYVAAKAPIIPSTVVQMNPVGSYLFPG